jgi:hypothetical protein
MFRFLFDYVQEETTDENSDLYSSVVSAGRLPNQFRPLEYTSGILTINIVYHGGCLKRTDAKERTKCFRVEERKEKGGVNVIE